MFKDQRMTRRLGLFVSCLFLFYVFPIDASARVGGGGSTGSRGSRSSTPPRSYSPSTPSAPSQTPKESASPPSKPAPSPQPTQPAAPPAPQPQISLWRGLAGGLVGGLIGGMLFSGLGFGANRGGLGGGIGLIEILMIGFLLYGIYWFIRKRRQEAGSHAYYQSSHGMAGSSAETSYGAEGRVEPKGDSDLETGLAHIRQMDPSFDEKNFKDLSMDYFFRIQGAWANREMSGVRRLLTDEMATTIQEEANRLRAERKINRLDNIAVRSVEIAEMWQESGRDFITVRFHANLLDYTVDEVTGQVVSGSREEPVKFEEYWTFSRPVGKNPWQLSAIHQAE